MFFFEMGYGKEWIAFNGNDNVGVYICDHREIRKLDGGWISHYLYVNPLWLTPTKTKKHLELVFFILELLILIGKLTNI